MWKVFTLLVLCLWSTQCEATRSVFVEPACSWEETSSYQLCQDFRDIRNLIDPNTLVYYISYGYFRDAEFKRAMDFIKTDRFQSVSQQLADTAAYRQLLRRFADAGVSTETIASVQDIFNCLMISQPTYGDEEEIVELEMQSLVVPRTLQDVATNLFNAIPRAKLRSLIRSKQQDSDQFARFYRTIRDSGFRRDVKKLFKSYEAKYPISVMKRNNIDLWKLLQLAYKVIDNSSPY
ncbi:uncharacterized protein LOC105221255 [Zeugodacus cucurbitae]|nr:uncharacterized protein LOC105221255 [Zeugodacus cucurbitae]